LFESVDSLRGDDKAKQYAGEVTGRRGWQPAVASME